MKSHIAAAALFLVPGFACAAETELASRIDRVTVYPDGAVVTRLGKAELLQGASQIVLRGLPATIDPSSIRVEGKGDGAFSVGAVDLRTTPGDAKPVLDATIEAKLKALREDKDKLEGGIAAIEAKRATIERFAQTGPDKLGPDGKALPVADWPAVFDAIGTALVKVQDELRGVRGRLVDVEAEIAALERAQPQPGRPGAPKRDVAIAVEAPRAIAAEFTVSYRVSGANWIPNYEARLVTTGDKPEIALTRRAEIRQRTGEAWDEVALTLSTTRSAGGTRAPELEQKAYLEAGFVHDDEAPLLAGRVALHRDGTYIGMGQFGLVAPGDKVELGFGADDRIKVTFAPVKRRENEPSWLGQSRTDLREFRTVVKSLHARPVKVTVLQRTPFSENSAITVETIAAQTTPPTEKQLGDKRGVSTWTFDLAPGTEKEIKLAYRIKWPGDRELSFEQQPLPPRAE